MGTRQFRKPLTQSALILCAVIILFTLISSSGSEGGSGGAILSFFSGIGNLLLLVIGLLIALPLSIAVLVAIFLGAVSLHSRENAAQMYSDLKTNIQSILRPYTDRWLCCNTDSTTSISQEEYSQMEQEIAQLKKSNVDLQAKIKDLNTGNVNVRENLEEVTEQNTVLKGQYDDLSQAVVELQNSEKELSGIITSLNAKFDENNDSELRDQIASLGVLNTQTSTSIDNIAERLTTLESSLKQAPTSGIFSYIKGEDDQKTFVETVQEALSQEMTYSQIDEFLTKKLGTKLDKIIKDHPSLTKNYIRNLRRE